MHKFGYCFELLKDILEAFGCDNVQDLTNSGKDLENEPRYLELAAKKKTKAAPHQTRTFFRHFDVTIKKSLSRSVFLIDFAFRTSLFIVGEFVITPNKI